MNLLTLSNVDAYYGAAHVLHQLSLTIEAGERVAVLGRNGVGKTTIVNTCLGIASLRRGEIRFGSTNPRSIRHFTAARTGISVVPQGRRIVPNLTVRENLMLGAAVRRQGRWTIDSVFDLFPILRERADTPGTALSGGQQQMLAIGRALMANPTLLVLDEPSEGLAPVIIDELGEIFVKLGEEGTAILLIEQNLGLIRQVAQRYYVLSKGAIVEAGDLAGISIDALKKHVTV